MVRSGNLHIKSEHLEDLLKLVAPRTANFQFE
jgi:hypothetical protein